MVRDAGGRSSARRGAPPAAQASATLVTVDRVCCHSRLMLGVGGGVAADAVAVSAAKVWQLAPKAVGSPSWPFIV